MPDRGAGEWHASAWICQEQADRYVPYRPVRRRAYHLRMGLRENDKNYVPCVRPQVGDTCRALSSVPPEAPTPTPCQGDRVQSGGGGRLKRRGRAVGDTEDATSLEPILVYTYYSTVPMVQAAHGSRRAMSQLQRPRGAPRAARGPRKSAACRHAHFTPPLQQPVNGVAPWVVTTTVKANQTHWKFAFVGIATVEHDY